MTITAAQLTILFDMTTGAMIYTGVLYRFPLFFLPCFILTAWTLRAALGWSAGSVMLGVIIGRTSLLIAEWVVLRRRKREWERDRTAREP